MKAGGYQAGGFWTPGSYLTVGASSIDIDDTGPPYRAVGWLTVTVQREVSNRQEAIT